MRLMATCLCVFFFVAANHSFAESDALGRLRGYIEVDTVNPPGNESRGVDYLAAIFDAAGVAYETAESAPGRGNIWARLKGGDKPALLLLHHIDVVPATRETWDSDPLQAVVKNGSLYGRGTLDTKSLGIMQLEAFLALHKSQAIRDRDVVFMATADEEAGGLFGAGWMIKNRPDAFADVGFLLNEGGLGRRAGEQVFFSIEVAQKRPYWLRLVATDEPGHGSMPQSTSAPVRLIIALNNIQQAPFEPRITPAVREMFRQLAPFTEPKWSEQLLNIDDSIGDPDFLKSFQREQPALHALIRNTCSITMLIGSQKINVVPPVVSAELDCRILPDQDADEFLQAIKSRVNDNNISVEEIMLFGAAESSTDNALYLALEDITRKYYPGAGVITTVAAGFTDSHFFRDLGIASYGYAPMVIPDDAMTSIHGNNERIGVETFEKGVQMMTELVERFATR
ncbi:MAG: M20/M25/M40 family metallo-hydrolase [Gammaproteobacteria bacterium]|nr:M20/M25/M40 family metallo-hydrolase [Gammaproteobacteria bacterium]